MNIKKAKEEVKNTLTAYFTKDKFDNYIIPIEKQRPVFLMGVAGIGKTAIMEQIASEMNIPLVSYSMTHHTRQSALGLPYINEKVFNGESYKVSEYTMSEIISTIYEVIEKTGSNEGILFLDEINCVSETLSPIMLQFLQYKIFGKHKVPKGFVVVTAGNPPEFNNSVREFDIATWDRVKRIDVKPDVTIWREYAIKGGVHSAITSYLDIKKDDFYSVTTTVDGKNFVTARGWEDLSQIIFLYEHHNLKIDKDLVIQYIQDDKIAKSFANYYMLYISYKKKYNIDGILENNIIDDVIAEIEKASFDERISIISLLVSEITSLMRNTVELLDICKGVTKELKSFQKDYNTTEELNSFINTKKDTIKKKIDGGSYTKKKEYLDNSIIEFLENLDTTNNNIDIFIKNANDFINTTIEKDKVKSDEISVKLSNIFSFLEKFYNEGQELLIFITELTTNVYSAKFIRKFGCEEYFKYNKELLLTDKSEEISNEIAKILNIEN